MVAGSGDGNLHDRNRDYDGESMLQTGRRDRRGACAHTPLDAAAPHSRAAAGLYPRGQIDIDVMKKGK